MNHLTRKTAPSSAEINQLFDFFNAGQYAELDSAAGLLISQYPDSGLPWKLLGTSLLVQGQAALPALQRAAVLMPDDAEVFSNLGNALQNLGQLDAAVRHYQQALALKPDFADAYNNMGAALQDLGQLPAAVASYQAALALKPDYADAHNNLGSAFQDLQQFAEAMASYQTALNCKPDFSMVHNNLGVLQNSLGQFNEAAASYRHALALDPDFAAAQNNLGNVLLCLGQAEAALTCYRKALSLTPGSAMVHSNLLFCLSHCEAMDAQELFAQYCRFADQFEAPLRPHWPQHGNPKLPDRCLQIGIVSADLYDHPVANFIEPVLAHLASDPQYTLHAYYNRHTEDGTTQRLRGMLRHWHPIAGLSDLALAQKIHADGIDILIDLSGHSAKHRLLAFAHKPAPIQLSWIGFPGTTGLQAMDYYLSDGLVLPYGQFDRQFTEKLLYLPAWAPFLPFEGAPPVNPLPALRQAHVTFGSFNRINKLNVALIAAWSQLLRALPDARMVLGNMPPRGQYDTLIGWFAKEGIAPERLDFHSRSSMPEFLALLHQIDLCLDSFPFNGATITCHALWMGVPTLTLSGATIPGRACAGLLGHVGLEAFVAHDRRQFVEKGVYWAAHRTELAALRHGLRTRFKQSALSRPDLITAALTRALRTMWQRWCAGKPAQSFQVNQVDRN